MTDAKDEDANPERARMRSAVGKAMEDPSMRLRLMVATRVLAIVDREIGGGEPSDPAEWKRLLALVRESDEGTRLIADLQGVIEKCRTEIAQRIEKGGVDEADLRKTLLTYIRASVLLKLKGPLTAALDDEDVERGV